MSLDPPLVAAEEAAVFFDQPHMPLDRGIDQRGRKAAIVELLLDDIAHGGRREVVRGREQRDDRSGNRITASFAPGIK